MLFRQLLDEKSRSLTYLVASQRGGEALLIDPVRDQVALYLRLLEAFDLRLALAIDTHSHHDRPSALGDLFEQTDCITAMGVESDAAVTHCFSDGDIIAVDGVEVEVLHTPGHTGDSYCFVMDDRVFTGDTLLIGGTGRTDLGGDARQQYASLFDKLLRLPGHTLVYPGHDYHGRHVSSIADERRLNPRLAAASIDEYVALMENVHPSDPRLCDVIERPSLHPSARLMRELIALKSALSAGAPIGQSPPAH